MRNNPKKLILIDGNAIIHRAYHALPPLTNKKGELLNAVYGFTSTILSVIDKFKPDYIIATFDLAGPTFRHIEFKEYKATRVKADQELYDQIPRVKEVTRAMGIPILEKEGFEADDVIGTIVKNIEKNNPEIENIIVTGDLDTLQLVSPKTQVYTMRRGLTDSVIYNEDAVKERYGLAPEQMIDYKGLRGDASDNIPGVKGIGEKTATELLKKYETLEGVYQNINEIKGAVKDKLERDKAMAIQSKNLATIRTNVPVEFDIEKALVLDFDREKLVELFKELNFFSLIKRLPGGSTKLQNDYKSTKVQKTEGIKDFKYEYINSEKLGDFVTLLEEQKEIAIKLKTTGNKYYNSVLQGVAISWKTGRASYLEYSENNLEKLKIILEDENIKKIGYDLKYDSEVLKNNNINLQGMDFDVLLSAYVLNPGGKIEFSNLVLSELGEEITEEKKTGQLGLNIESSEETAQKYCQLADYILKLKSAHQSKIEAISAEQSNKNNLREVFRELEMPLAPILASMEMHGVKLNKVIFAGISEKITARIKNLEKGIYDAAGIEFNINSPKQLTEILFEKLKLPTQNIKKGKTGYSTASTELEKLKKEHKIIEKIEEYREIFKLKTTYLDALPLLVDKNSRIHTTFNQAVTATGRLSSSDPNLQNIPIRTDLGQLLRVAFEAEKGWCLVAADYSQIDLRVMAHVSDDKKLKELFYQGEDIHRATAALINGVTMSQVTDKMRRNAKALNFGVIYGMSVFGFSQGAGIDRDQAKKFIDEYFEKFPGVADFMKSTKESARKLGYVETEMGRRRYIPEINSPNFQVAGAAERMAINMPIQGMSADIVKLAMIEVYKFITNDERMRTNARMILQVHDEIILEVKEDIAEEIARKVKEIMKSVYKLSVPLVVDVKTGDNWGEV
ncbi:MAG: DNA polymerase I [Candidatus Moranbacteria bacterium RIFOXYA12_FULL_44_15]|nr:MAG: DNA polymerase I [Candidatus Moranbacteria bacterium RIFOXYA12_FULL_44_15]OGI34809.1 MAG: DNA polymerase I [Candidatus Moranbacteria bacterium RIFOXYA2_FULL_43_15]